MPNHLVDILLLTCDDIDNIISVIGKNVYADNILAFTRGKLTLVICLMEELHIPSDLYLMILKYISILSNLYLSFPSECENIIPTLKSLNDKIRSFLNDYLQNY